MKVVKLESRKDSSNKGDPVLINPTSVTNKPEESAAVRGLTPRQKNAKEREEDEKWKRFSEVFSEDKVQEEDESWTGDPTEIKEWYLRYWALLLFELPWEFIRVNSIAGIICNWVVALLFLASRYGKYNTIRPVIPFLKQSQRKSIIGFATVLYILCFFAMLFLPIMKQSGRYSDEDNDIFDSVLYFGSALFGYAGEQETADDLERISRITSSDYVTVFHVLALSASYLRIADQAEEITSYFGASSSEYTDQIQKMRLFLILSLAGYLICGVYIIYTHYRKQKTCGVLVVIFATALWSCSILFGSSLGVNRLTMAYPAAIGFMGIYLSTVLWFVAWNPRIENPNIIRYGKLRQDGDDGSKQEGARWWVCPKCGRENSRMDNMCQCGTFKY